MTWEVPSQGATLEAEGEEALASKGCVKTHRHDNYTRKNKDGATLTWGPGPSSDPGSGTFAVVVVVAAAVVAAAGAPGGDHPQAVVVAAGPTVVVAVVAADPMVVVAVD
jgi:hypothetical protein